jgi:hypothetical protein
MQIATQAKAAEIKKLIICAHILKADKTEIYKYFDN